MSAAREQPRGVPLPSPEPGRARGYGGRAAAPREDARARLPRLPRLPRPLGWLRAFFVNEAPLSAAVTLSAREPKPELEPEPEQASEESAAERLQPAAGGRALSAPSGYLPPRLAASPPQSAGARPGVRAPGGARPTLAAPGAPRRRAPWEPRPAPAAAPCGPGPCASEAAAPRSSLLARQHEPASRAARHPRPPAPGPWPEMPGEDRGAEGWAPRSGAERGSGLDE